LIKQLQAQGIDALPDAIALQKMPPSMWKNYVSSFNQAQNAIKKQAMSDLNAQLSMYRRFGNNVGQAIQQGLADEAPGLRRELRNMLKQMFPQLTKTPTSAKTGGGGGTTTKTTTHNHNDTTHIHTKSDPKDIHTALARHRTLIRNRPRYSPRGGGD
jgi:hypothetical protein